MPAGFHEAAIPSTAWQSFDAQTSGPPTSVSQILRVKIITIINDRAFHCLVHIVSAVALVWGSCVSSSCPSFPVRLPSVLANRSIRSIRSACMGCWIPASRVRWYSMDSAEIPFKPR